MTTFIVTGTDTDIGKTVFSAGLTQALQAMTLLHGCTVRRAGDTIRTMPTSRETDVFGFCNQCSDDELGPVQIGCSANRTYHAMSHAMPSRFRCAKFAMFSSLHAAPPILPSHTRSYPR